MQPLNIVVAPLKPLISVVADRTGVVSQEICRDIDVPRAKGALPTLLEFVQGAPKSVPARLCVLIVVGRSLLGGQVQRLGSRYRVFGIWSVLLHMPLELGRVVSSSFVIQLLDTG